MTATHINLQTSYSNIIYFRLLNTPVLVTELPGERPIDRRSIGEARAGVRR